MTEDEKLDEMRRRLHQTRREDDEQLDGFIRASLTDEELDRDRDVMRQLAKEARNAERASESRQSGWTVFGLFRERIRVLVPGVVIGALLGLGVASQLLKQPAPPVIVIKTNAPSVIDQPSSEPPKPMLEIVQPQGPKPEELKDLRERMEPDFSPIPEPPKQDRIVETTNRMGSRGGELVAVDPDWIQRAKEPPPKYQVALKLARDSQGAIDFASSISSGTAAAQKIITPVIENYIRDYESGLKRRILENEPALTSLILSNAVRLLAVSDVPTTSADFNISLSAEIDSNLSGFEGRKAKMNLSAKVTFYSWEELATGAKGGFKSSNPQHVFARFDLEFFRSEIALDDLHPKQ